MSNVRNLGPTGAPRQILGREPAAIIAAIQSVLTLALAFGWLAPIGLDGQGDLAVVVALLNGVAALYLAWGTTETALAAVVEVIKGGIALAAIYGLQISTEETGLLIAAVTAIATAWFRGQTSPLARGSFSTIQPDDVSTPPSDLSVQDARVDALVGALERLPAEMQTAVNSGARRGNR